jgi:hypothetical protein
VGGNRSKAARLLGIGRTTVWRKLKAKQASCETSVGDDTVRSSDADKETSREDIVSRPCF